MYVLYTELLAWHRGKVQLLSALLNVSVPLWATPNNIGTWHCLFYKSLTLLHGDQETTNVKRTVKLATGKQHPPPPFPLSHGYNLRVAFIILLS